MGSSVNVFFGVRIGGIVIRFAAAPAPSIGA
jgi:hypothetical protein